MTHKSINEQLIALLQHLEGAYASNTLRAYKSDMLEFIFYCNKTGACALPALPTVVATFLMQTIGQNIKSSTIRRKVSSISAIHRLSCHDDPTKHPEAKIALRKIFRQLGTRFDQAYPVTRQVLEKLLSVCNNDLHGLRDNALLLVAYDSMRRRSELVSLRIEDIEWHSGGGASILLRKSKTDQLCSGKWIYLTAETANSIKTWISAANINSGFVFRGIRGKADISNSLCESRIARIYKTMARRAGLSEQIIQGISGHSMRVGGAQDLLSCGASRPQIMIKGGWGKTDTVMRYVDRIRALN
jgi:site-specific recombinase XerD